MLEKKLGILFNRLFFLLVICILVSECKICNEYYTQDYCPRTQPILNISWCGGFLPRDALVFGIIGDYGLADANCEGHVAYLVDYFEKHVKKLDFVMTLGDNNYWNGHCSNMEKHIGQYYGRFFNPGDRCVDPIKKRTVKENRFFPCIGNHDWDHFNYAYENVPYLQYFDYLKDFGPAVAKGVWYNKSIGNGMLEIFSLNSNLGTPAANDFDKYMHEIQKNWVKQALKDSQALYKLVFFHHPAYTTSKIGSGAAPWMAFNFTEWGATMVLNGHHHVYERLLVDNLPYIINGLGGHPWLYTIHDCDIEPGSQFRYNAAHGALFAAATKTSLEFCFYNIKGETVDKFTVTP